MYNTIKNKRNQPRITDPFSANGRGIPAETKLRMENGISPAIICNAVKGLMKSSDASFYELSGEDVTKRVNLITSCSRMCGRNRKTCALAIA